MIEYFLMTLFDTARQDLTELLPKKRVDLVKDFSKRYFVNDVATPEPESILHLRQHFLAIMLIGLSQGYNFLRGDIFVELMDLNFTSGTSILTQYLMGNYSLSGQEALTQTNTLKFVMKYGPEFISRMPYHEIVKLLNGMHKSPAWRAIWHEDEVTDSDRPYLGKLELRVIGYMLMIMFFGDFPVTSSTYLDRFMVGEKPGNFVELRAAAAKVLLESNLEVVSGNRVNKIAMLFYAVISVLETLGQTATIFMDTQLENINLDAFSYMMHNRMQIKSIRTFDSKFCPAIVVYSEMRAPVNQILTENQNVTSVKWVSELPTIENFRRIFDAYRDSSLQFLEKLVGGIDS